MAEAASSSSRPRSMTPASPPSKKARLDGESELAAAPTPKKQSKQPKKRKFKRPASPEPGTSEDVILRDVMALLGSEAVQAAKDSGSDYTSPLERGQEIELVVSELSSNGESISVVPSSISSTPWAVLVPFALPGETIRARIYANNRLHSMADLVSVVKTNDEMRDNSLVKCRYFGTCAGCQYQMLSYDAQLKLKQRVVEKAYQNYSGLPTELVPPILPTIPSPKTYGYRTKITPHFDLPQQLRKPGKGVKPSETVKDVPAVDIGFAEKGRRRVMDIEECVIATQIINKALPAMRENVKKNISTYKRGATLLLRDSLKIPSKSGSPLPESSASSSKAPVAGPVLPESSASTIEQEENAMDVTLGEQEVTISDSVEGSTEEHVCISNHKATVRERVGSTLYEFPAGSFFQNNNSVLQPLVQYVQEAIFTDPSDEPTHLVDTYCGAGFFALSLAPCFVHVTGVEISVDSIASARHNAQLNGLPPPSPTPSIRTQSITFSAGKSESIFESVSHFPPSHTVVIIDPPRKGCDKAFLQQLVKFKPRTLVYVSCNVHTQARDLGDLTKLMAEAERGPDGVQRKFVIRSIRGFDLFPQTSHVESVAVLNLV